MSFRPHCIIQDKCDERAWHMVPETDELTLVDAIGVIDQFRSNHTVLSAWVTETDKPLPVHFKCYIDILGRVWPE